MARWIWSFICAFLLLSLCWAKDDFKPIPPDELQLKEVPGAKGAHAVLLYYELLQDDQKGRRTVYYRIKVLTEEGKKYANVELPPYYPDVERFDNIRARVVQPDGRSVPYAGKFLDKLVARKKEVKVLSKTFNLPDVQIGSIIEYTYSLSWDRVYDSTFIFQHALFVRKSHISLTASQYYAAAFVTFPMGTNVKPVLNGRVITLDADNIPAFESESFIPPEDEIKARFYVFYAGEKTKSIDDFWKDAAKNWKEPAEKYMDEKSNMKREVSSIVQPGDSNEQKLRKIYARVQKIRDLSYEEEVTEKEQKHQNIKDIDNVSDILKYGYGYHNGINRLFVALAREAGFDADIVRVVDRDGHFFHKELLSFRQLTDELAVVTLDGKDLYFSPSTPFCPYGILPWEDTDTQGVRWSKDAISFVKIPAMSSSDSLTSRKSVLQLDEDGALAGEVTLSFDGADALAHRLSLRYKDDTDRKKSLEAELKEDLPSTASADVVKVGSWTESGPLEVVFKVKIPEYGASAGKRLIIPEYPFQGSKGHAFQQSKRVNFIYFRHPWTESDEITLKLPEGYTVDKLPTPQSFPSPLMEYAVQVKSSPGALNIQRKLIMRGAFIAPEYYPMLQGLYNRVKANDDNQIALQTAAK